MKLGKYIGNFVRREIERFDAVLQERAELYRRCFEGTPEEVERKLQAYDYVSDIMRPRRI